MAGNGKSAEYATFLQETEGYTRKVLGLKRSDTVPEGATSYDGMTFLCYEATASMDRDGLTCITRNNVVCGGAVYCGIGSRRLSKPDFDQGLEMVVGENRAYSTKETMRRVNQQLAALRGEAQVPGHGQAGGNARPRGRHDHHRPAAGDAPVQGVHLEDRRAGPRPRRHQLVRHVLPAGPSGTRR